MTPTARTALLVLGGLGVVGVVVLAARRPAAGAGATPLPPAPPGPAQLPAGGGAAARIAGLQRDLVAAGYLDAAGVDGVWGRVTGLALYTLLAEAVSASEAAGNTAVADQLRDDAGQVFARVGRTGDTWVATSATGARAIAVAHAVAHPT